MSEESKAAILENLETVNKIHPIVTVGLDEIEVDESLNARKAYDPELVTGLVSDIRRQGLLNPLVLIRNPKPRSEFKYLLIGGFTRVKALREIEKENRKAGGKGIAPVEATAKILDFSGAKNPELEAHLSNLIENTMRRDLKPYDIAMKARFLKEKYGITGAEIANRLGAQKNYINNLLRVAANLHEDILNAWRDGHDLAKLDRLIKLAPKDHDDQLAQWELWLNPPSDDNEDEDEDDGEGSKKKGKKSAKKDDEKPAQRPRFSVLESAIEAVRVADGLSDDARKAAVSALKFAAGLSPRIPGIYDPNKVVRNPAGVRGKKPKKSAADSEPQAEA